MTSLLDAEKARGLLFRPTGTFYGLTLTYGYLDADPI